jgi:adenylate cyclase
MTLWKNALVGLAAAVVFALLYLTGTLHPIEDRLYDFFLRFRANRPRINSVVFLDVDDTAIAYNGVYPWPRSIPADGLLRLKEYGARAAIFDIEYIDRGPQGVDSVYLDHGLGGDFNRSFSGISSAAADIFSALKAGRIGQNDIGYYAQAFSSFINDEQKELYARAQGIARDNDRYLAQALALFGRSWSTLNLREFPLDGEQAERRPIAEERFSYPVDADPGASRGGGFIDILPVLPVFAQAAAGAGFTNVEVDNDGVRRRIYLAQKIDDHWYLQLVFAPLVHYLGSPGIQLGKRTLTIKQANLPNGIKKDIVIPLDGKGRMMLDWPKEDYVNSYKPHISFANFSLLDEVETEIETYSRALADADLAFFAQFEPSLVAITVMLGNVEQLFDAAHEAKNNAIENISDDSFEAFLDYRSQSYAILAEILALNAAAKVDALAEQLCAENPENAQSIAEEAEYIGQLLDALNIDMERRKEISEFNKEALWDKFCIIGRVDTGTTDYGANPFWGKYVNVGTHAVVLDTILSQSFIIPLNTGWIILFMLVFIPLFFLFSGGLEPVQRAAAGFAVAALLFIGAAAVLRFTGVFFAPLGTVLAMTIAVIAREIMSYAGSEKEKSFIRAAFSTYVSGDVVKEIISDPSRLQLGGTKRYMTAIFTDVKGFSTISEKLDPEDLVSLLNRYLSAMSDIVLKEKGTIDKYEGDAIIAFFGAPLDLSDHALRACVSAITMKKIEAELNIAIMENKLSPSPLLTRIGVNTGFMVAGNMGTENKMNYTIMGNAVNLAARLEGVNKQYGTWILASGDTVRETGDKLLTRRLDRVRVVGINEPVRLHELLDMAESASEEQRKLAAVFHEALENFEKRLWKTASDGFKEALSVIPEDPPSKIYIERCEQFLMAPPEDGWDGVYNLTSK